MSILAIRKRCHPVETLPANRGRAHLPTSVERGAKQGETPSTLRWPAQELDIAVLGALIQFLKDETRFIELMGSVDAMQMRHRLTYARGMAERLTKSTTPDQIEILNRLLARISVQADRIDIAVRINALWSETAAPSADEPTLSLDVPVQ
jgi:hypothetical protein